MTRSIAHAWRVVATGFCFAVFGIGGLLFGLALLPIARALPGSLREREFRCQRVVHHGFRLFVGLMRAVGVIRVHVADDDALRRPGQLVVANHPSLIDVVLLVSRMPQADCVVKRGVLSNPFMRGVAYCAGYLSNDLGDELIDECAQRLRAGRSLVLFPEGTRSPAGGLGEFQRGAAHVALRSDAPLLPVVIRCHPPGLMRGQRWWDVPERAMAFDLECGAAIPAAGAVDDRRGRGAAARRLTAELRDFYVKKLQTQPLRGG